MTKSSAFQINDRVRILNPEHFTEYPLVEQAFARADYQGVIERIELDTLYAPYSYVVETPDKSQHEFFKAEEIALTEGSE